MLILVARKRGNCHYLLVTTQMRGMQRSRFFTAKTTTSAHSAATVCRKLEPSGDGERNPDVLARIRDEFGFAQATTDWREVIEARPDLVVLTGPVHLRAEQARAALEAGAHVLAEKPFTVTSADAWDLARLAEERDRVLMICYAWNEIGIVENDIG